MAETILMKKGERFADIYDSPETIAQAKRDGYHLCDEMEQKEHDDLLNPKKVAAGKPDFSKATKGVMLAYAEKAGIYTADMDGLNPKQLRTRIAEIWENTDITNTGSNDSPDGKDTGESSDDPAADQSGQE